VGVDAALTLEGNRMTETPQAAPAPAPVPPAAPPADHPGWFGRLAHLGHDAQAIERGLEEAVKGGHLARAASVLDLASEVLHAAMRADESHRALLSPAVVKALAVAEEAARVASEVLKVA
jgi:hypothetical protein